MVMETKASIASIYIYTYYIIYIIKDGKDKLYGDNLRTYGLRGV
jgi:hypothetical protein